MMQTFREWFPTTYLCIDRQQFSLEDLKVAYEAGWDACRDKWGGLEYVDTLMEEQRDKLK